MQLLLSTLLAASVVSGRSVLEYRATPQVYSSCINDNDIALTFDDGPYIYLRNISDQFTAANAKATFFMNGNNWDCIYNPDRISDVKYAYAAGHMIGSHTWSHGDLSTFSSDQIEDGMYRVEEAFSRILGIKPAFMRPPYGDTNSNVQTIAAGRGQSLALWDQDTGDADGNTVAQSEAVYNAVAKAKPKNALILQHETEETTATTLVPYAIKLFQGEGYNLVTLAECLGVDPYQAIGVPQAQSDAWTCDGTPAPGKGCGGSITCETGTPLFSSAAGSSTSGAPTAPSSGANGGTSSTASLPNAAVSPAATSGGSTPAPSDSNTGSHTSSPSATPSGKTGGARALTVPAGALAGVIGLMMLL
ncbi:hypothetical protein MSAN_02503800 [Mycena sanguinolenta]|uniref:NodB homology domain-containing protein n=1 Tax=Mycena sanguinolenta TaxID=230812 RepID=A0A8H6U192_9AGAR|nr:hypothetical protein MSAN_02503800 [Mycena sanguinolenta]